MSNRAPLGSDSLTRLLRLSSLVAIAVGLFAIIVGATLLYGGMQGQLHMEQATRAVEDRARAIGGALNSIQATLGDPQVQQLARELIARDGTSGDALLQAVRARGVANVLELRAFPPAVEEIEPGQYPNPDFPVIEMLLEARRTGSAPIQVQYPGTANENLAFAQGIGTPGEADGVLFLRVPVSVVTALLNDQGPLDYVALVQDTGAAPAVLRSLGSPGGRPQTTEISGSRLVLQWSRSAMVDPMRGSDAVIVAAIGILLLMGGILIRQRTRVAAELRTDSPPQAPAVRVEPALVERPADRPPTRPAKAAAPPVEPEGTVVDDLPDWLLDSEEPKRADRAQRLYELPDPLSETQAPETDELPDAAEDKPSRPTPLDTIPSPETVVLSEDIDSWFESSSESTAEPTPGPAAAAKSKPEPARDEAPAGFDFDFEKELEALARLDEVDEPPAVGTPSKAARSGAEVPEIVPEPEPDLDFGIDPLPPAKPPQAASRDKAAPSAPKPEPAPVAPVAKAPAAQPSAPKPPAQAPVIDPALFRTGNIGGVIDETLDARSATLIGQAIAAEARERGIDRIAVGRDGRLHGAVLLSALTQGLRSGGIDVIDVGAVPIPVLRFAALEWAAGSGVMVTGSHYPSDQNGFRIHLAGETLHDEGIRRLFDRIQTSRFANGEGALEEQSVVDRYLQRIGADVQLERPLKVVVDCGNGITGNVAPEVLAAIGADVIPLYADVDGSFPNHLPDPADPANLEDLKLCVRNFQADLGIAFDGDGDRLAVLSSSGDLIWPDRLLMLLAPDILKRNPGAAVVHDVACSSSLTSAIEGAGGKSVLTRSADPFVAEQMRQEEAPLGGLANGHLFVAERWYPIDDAIYAAARLLELLAADTRPPAEILAILPGREATPQIRLPMAAGEAEDLVMALIAEANFGKARLSTLDGLRVDFDDGWGLVRASHTGNDLVLRFEGEDGKALNRIKSLFKKQLKAVAPGLALMF